MNDTLTTAAAAEFFAEMFQPRHLSNVTSHSVQKYRCVINRAGDYLGRELLISDLSDELISGLSEWLTEQGMVADRAQVYRQCLRALAADAQRHGHKTGWVSSVDPLNQSKCHGNRRQKMNHDLRGPKARNRRLIAKAASLFAAGHNLPEIGAMMNLSEHAIHNWRSRYRALWDASYRDAAARLVELTRSEASKRAEKQRVVAHTRKTNGAEKFLREQGLTLVADDNPTGEGKRVSELISDMAGERGWEPNTLRHYQDALAHIERWSGRVLYCHEFNTGWVNDYLAEIENSHLSSATVRGRRTHILALWRAAFENDLCRVPPLKVRRVKLIHKAPEAWSGEEVNQLLATAAQLTGCYGKGRDRITRSLLWRLTIRVLWDTGLRMGDAARLKISDLGRDGILQLSQGKTGRWHVCRLHASTLNLVRELRLPDSSLLTPWPVSGELRSRHWRLRIVQPCGLIGPLKKLRKSSASDVELHHPGMGAFHLGHHLAGSIAHNHYLDPRIVAKNQPMPTELTGDI